MKKKERIIESSADGTKVRVTNIKGTKLAVWEGLTFNKN